MRHLSIHRRTTRRGMTAGFAVAGAVMWCTVIIALVLIWNNPDDRDLDDRVQTDKSAESMTRPVASTTDDRQPEVQQSLSLPAREIPDFTLEECMGGEFGLADLKGKPWVASFIFTRCIATCPQISLAMKDLHDRIAEQNPHVMFVTLTVDSDFDNATILQGYSETFLPDRHRWKFLTGNKPAMHDIIVNGFGIFVKENLGDARRPGMEVAHSNRVVLVNPEGFPVGKFLGTKADDMADLAQILSGQKPFPDPLPQLQFSISGGGPEGLDIQISPVAGSKHETDQEEEAAGQASDPNGPQSDTTKQSAAVPLSNQELSTSLRLARIDRLLPRWAKALPTVNAILNSTSAILLLLGWLAIRGGHRTRHRNFMISAFVVSVAFLGCYLTSHWALSTYTGERGRPFAGDSIARIVYYVILWPHVALAATVPFFAVRVFQHAAAERWDKHRRLARIAFPIWMYVSVTGVVIYGMLYHWPQVA